MPSKLILHNELEMEIDAEEEIDKILEQLDLKGLLIPLGLDVDEAMEYLKYLPIFNTLCAKIERGAEDMHIPILNFLHCDVLYNSKTRGMDYEINLRISFEDYEYITTRIRDELLDIGIPYSCLSIYEFINNLVRQVKITCQNLSFCYVPHPTMKDEFIEYCTTSIIDKFLSFCKNLKEYCKDNKALYDKLFEHYEWLTPEYFGWNTQINLNPNALEERYNLLCDLGFYGYHGYRKIVSYNYSYCGLHKEGTYKFLPYYLQIEKYKKSRAPTPKKCEFFKLEDSGAPFRVNEYLQNTELLRARL